LFFAVDPTVVSVVFYPFFRWFGPVVGDKMSEACWTWKKDLAAGVAGVVAVVVVDFGGGDAGFEGAGDDFGGRAGSVVVVVRSGGR